ncbi:RNA polymerase sigma factor region1.1 domain-containing protein [Methylobacterium sp. CM6257]
MSQTIDRGTLDRLIALGRSRGELTVDDLRAALPVERMDVDALVLVMLELEAAGVSVEPEAFGPPTDRSVPSPAILPARDPGSVPPIRRAEGVAVAVSATAPVRQPTEATQPAPEDRAGVNRAIVLAGLATLLVLGAVLLML